MSNKIIAGFGVLIIALLMWSSYISNRATYYKGFGDGVELIGALIEGESQEEALKKYDKYNLLYERKKEREKK